LKAPTNTEKKALYPEDEDDWLRVWMTKISYTCNGWGNVSILSRLRKPLISTHLF
jgi:hypothetical protein